MLLWLQDDDALRFQKTTCGLTGVSCVRPLEVDFSVTTHTHTHTHIMPCSSTTNERSSRNISSDNDYHDGASQRQESERVDGRYKRIHDGLIGQTEADLDQGFELRRRDRIRSGSGPRRCCVEHV